MITVICILRTLLHSVSAYAMCVDIDETAMWCASSRIAGASTMINAVQPCRDDQGSHHHSGDEPLHEDMPGDGPDEPVRLDGFVRAVLQRWRRSLVETRAAVHH